MSGVIVDPAVAGDVVLLPASVAVGEQSQPVEAACIALDMLDHYAQATNQSASVRVLVVDAVADLMHLCAQSGFSFDAVVAEAASMVAADYSTES